MTVDNGQRIGQITEGVARWTRRQADPRVNIDTVGVNDQQAFVLDNVAGPGNNLAASTKTTRIQWGPLKYAVGPGDGTGGRV